MCRLPYRGIVHMEVAAYSPDHHLAAIQPDPHVDRNATAPLDLGRILLDRGLHGERRVARPHGVVLMRQRRAKQGHDAVAHDLIDGALIAVHRGHHALQHRVKDCRASSGSRSASSSIEPFRSAKSTVTCLRSPSSTLFEARIFSARYRGV